MSENDGMVNVQRLSLSHSTLQQRRVSPEMMRLRDAVEADEEELREAVKGYIKRWG